MPEPARPGRSLETSSCPAARLRNTALCKPADEVGHDRPADRAQGDVTGGWRAPGSGGLVGGKPRHKSLAVLPALVRQSAGGHLLASNLTRNIGFVTSLALFGLWLDKAGGGGRQEGRSPAAGSAGTASPSAAREADDGPRGETERGETGRGAKVPSELPPRGWFQILKRVISEIGEDAVLSQAASITFYALLALFPALAALVSLYGLIADPKTLSAEVASLSGVLPGGGMAIITDQLKSLASSPSKALGIGVIIGLLTSLWSANAGMKALFDALNVVYGEREKRSYIRRTVISLAFTLGTILFLILALVGIVVLPAVLNFVGLGGTTALLLKFGRWPVLIVAISVFPRPGISLRSQPGQGALAMGELGQRRRGDPLADRFATLLLLCFAFRELQQNLRFARRGDRLHDLDVAIRQLSC